MTGPNRGRLTAGTLQAFVPARAHGFTVDLPGGTRVVDLGTAFVARVSEDGVVDVHVTEGNVRVDLEGRRWVSQTSVELSAGQGRRFDPSQAMITRLPGASHGPIEGLIAYWPLDTDATCQWGGSRTSRLQGDAAIVNNGRTGGALKINGHGGIEADPVDLSMRRSDLAISLWFNRQPDPRTNLRLLSLGGSEDDDHGYALFAGDHNLHAIVRKGERIATGGRHRGLDQWQHVVANFDRNGKLEVYLNGQRIASTDLTPFAGQDILSTKPLHIGRSVKGSKLDWIGMIDEVRIYRRTLSETEIRQLAGAEANRPATATTSKKESTR